MIDIIEEFQSEHRFLSNFWLCYVELDFVVYSSVEHAYQAAKFKEDSPIRSSILEANSPGVAKRLARKNQKYITAHFTINKLAIMEMLLRQKFSSANPHLLGLLLSTEDKKIVEGNNWGDRFWGVSPVGSDKGQNNLGKLLMRIRADMR